MAVFIQYHRVVDIKAIVRLVFSLFIMISLSGCTTDESHNSAAIDGDKIEFNRDIRPILNASCTGCHGGVMQQAGISFIMRDAALGRGHSGRRNIVPGDPDASELIARVESTDPNVRMPYKAKPLSPAQIATLRSWIAQGAQWEEHWAFVPPESQAVPDAVEFVSGDPTNLTRSTINNTVNNAIDNFVQEKLVEKGLRPAKRADKSTLLRRLSFDLTGLPPSPTQIDDFRSDKSPNAFEKQVDYLLDSPAFGERWAAMWLDIARYADSQGYTRDEYRVSWPYRDWVISAFNDNLSYKDFVVKQLAGDLLPARTMEDLIATGFHRQTPNNNEGGTDDEEFRVVAMLDRVSTTWSALNGLSMNCVQCHSHPYDPIEHSEFYKFYSFLNTAQDADRYADVPHLRIARDENEREALFELQEYMQQIAHEQTTNINGLADDAAQWQQLNIVSATANEIAALNKLIVSTAKRIAEIEDKESWPYKRNQRRLKQFKDVVEKLSAENGGQHDLALVNGELFADESIPPQAIVELKTDVNTSKKVSAIRVTALPVNLYEAAHTPDWAFSIDNIKLWLTLPNQAPQLLPVQSYLTNSLEVQDEQLKRHNGVNGNLSKTENAAGFFAHRLFRPRWTVAVLPESIELPKGASISIELAFLGHRRLNDKPPQLRRLRLEVTDNEDWLVYVNSPERQKSINQYVEYANTVGKTDTYNAPVILEQSEWDKRASALFYRGNFLDKQGEHLVPDTPAILPSFPVDVPRNRLTMAEWFFHDEQPLTARVAVNRFWFQLFGRGLVDTLEDFGGAGNEPSHPELLDWLALHFQHELNWDVKALIKLMVMSYSYQQDASATEAALDTDPANMWIARGPRQRLSAEMIRDQALFAAGLLSKKMGGEPVMPPQPAGIWGRKGRLIKDWENAKDEDRYRRAIYTFIKRAYTYPSFLTFDMETRELSHPRRIPTNTPLQALVTLNDPVFHEAAQGLAARMLSKKRVSQSDEQALRLGAELVLSRPPSKYEMARLNAALEALHQEFFDTKVNADTPEDQKLSDVWTAVASILLNLDAALTR
ncbi:PSD1 and planctomycete cytochrome C domain-containing protein [Agaribacter marinus]|nr:PSD1 and planctomycete cytochrome C domain-containing protein [Agaribacter marinus]